jgi:hypothetical protein
VTAEQAQATIRGVLDAVERTTDSDQLRALAQAVSALVQRLTADQAQVGLDSIGRITDPDQLVSIVQAVSAAAPRLTAEQAQVVLDAIGKTSNVYRLKAVVQAIPALASRLTADQAQTAIMGFFDAIGRPDTHRSDEPPPPPPPAPPPPPPPPPFLALSSPTPPGEQNFLAEAISALAPKLTADQAQAALAHIPSANTASYVLSELMGTTDSYQLSDQLLALAQTAQPLISRLQAAQKQAAMQHALDMMGKSTDFYEFGGVALTVSALSPTPEQSQAALDRVFDAIMVFRYSPDLSLFSMAAQELAPRLTAVQAQAAIQRALDAMEKLNDLYQQPPKAAFGQTVPMLASRLTSDESQDALGRILDAVGKTSSPLVRGSLAAAVQELTPKLTAAQAELAVDRVRSALGWSVYSDEAQQWAKAFVALIDRSPDPNSAGKVLVEAMKFPVAAGEPSDEMLTALQKRMTSLPGSTAGLRANLDWLKQNETSVDLSSPAVCPPSPREELRCPAEVFTFTFKPP